MHEITVDLETTANGGIKGTSPEAHYKNNRVLLCGWMEGGTTHSSDRIDGLMELLIDCIDRGDDVRLIGHNLKFDLKYLMRDRPRFPWHKLDYYCTMYSEYRQSGHRERFSSLEDSCARHGINFTKGLDLGAIIKGGTKMEDIPRSDLEPYLRDDVEATHNLYCRQIGHASYDEYWHQHVAPLANMELLGLPIDGTKTGTAMGKLVLTEQVHDQNLWDYCAENLEWSDGSVFESKHIKYTSPRTVSYLLTNEPAAGLTPGRVKKQLVWKQGCGPLLTRSEIIQVWGNTVPTNLGYPMPKAKLDDLAKLNGTAGGYINHLLKYRQATKLIGTYYGPFLEEANHTGGTIHPKMNMNTTGTGRLSSSAPNGQNMPEEARNCVSSQYGKLHEIDFKQLEVLGLAYLSGCKDLIGDIQDGEDIHFNTGKSVMGWAIPADMTDKDRKLVKNVNFGVIYGGGAAGLAAQTGQPKKLVKELIDSFYSQYPGVAVWQKDFYKEVVRVMKPDSLVQGEQVYSSLVKEPKSQRKFYFKEGPAPAWIRKRTGRKFSFKPTETKNYPVQGFAGGDIVMMALWELYYRLYDYDLTEIRMTVHDSILVDTDMKEVQLYAIMRDVCDDVRAFYGLPFELDFDIQSGLYWQ